MPSGVYPIEKRKGLFKGGHYQLNTGRTHFQKGREDVKRGKTYEEFYGKSKATDIKTKISNSHKTDKVKEIARRVIMKTISSGKMRKVINTKPELKMKEILEEMSLRSNVDYAFQKRIDNYLVDFYLPMYCLVILVDGEYWHNYPNHSKTDLVQNKILRQKGYTVLRFWASDILKNKEIVKRKIKQMLFK
jgi:very-short-patch-repair endonuclease